MLNSPFWGKPYITQKFGGNPQLYVKYGLKGHNGLDFRANNKTVYATHEGVATIHDNPNNPYGRYIRIKRMSFDGGYETIYAHLNKILVKDGQVVKQRQIIARSGNTGTNTTGPHLHFGLRFYNPDGTIKDKSNGYSGYINPIPYFQMGKI